MRQKPFQRLLEIGPGGGALTKYLMQIPGIDFKCVEVDDEKVGWLLQTYPGLQGKIIHGDFLQIDRPFQENFTVVGNFPYNISSQILFRLLEWKDNVEAVTGMFQKEVAQRIASTHGSKVYGVLSVLMQAFFSVEYLFDVGGQSFKPPPKVKSAVIRLTPRQEQLPMHSEKYFKTLVKKAFNQRRKTLRNAVKDLFDAPVLGDALFNKRAEQLGVTEFGELTFRMK